MPDRKNDNKKKQQRNTLVGYVKSQFGDNISGEIRDLIDASVRRQWTLQQFVTRFANTHYFHHQFPGLVERNGSIANALTGEQGVGVSPQSLAGAIRNYRTAEEDFKNIAQTYGIKDFGKRQLAAAIKSDTSAQEYAARLQAIDTVDSNPEFKNILMQNLKNTGRKLNDADLYHAAVGSSDKGFMDVYEQSQYQYQLGLSQREARDVSIGKASATGASTFQNVDQVVAAARQNLQAIGPELQSQGIGAAQLVKVLNNPGAYSKEMDTISQILQSRKGLYGRPVPGTYAQQGAGGGLSQYQPQGEASYG